MSGVPGCCGGQGATPCSPFLSSVTIAGTFFSLSLNIFIYKTDELFLDR